LWRTFYSLELNLVHRFNINPATQYIEFRVSRIFRIKAWLAGKGHSLGNDCRDAEGRTTHGAVVESHNKEAGYS